MFLFLFSLPGSGRSPEVGNTGNPLQYSYLENSIDRGTWQATVHGVAKTKTGLNMHAHTERSCCDLCQSVFSYIFLFSFIVSDLTFRSLIHFEFIFVYGVRECVLLLFFYLYLSSFHSTTFWRDCFFSSVCSCLLCHRWGDHRCFGLSLGFLSCFIDLYFCFYANIILSCLL